MLLWLAAAITLFLLEHRTGVKDKNNLGWTALNEAISMGDRDTSIMNNYFKCETKCPVTNYILIT